MGANILDEPRAFVFMVEKKTEDMQHVSPECLYPSIKSQGITSQMTVIFSVIY
jgi:hypothetical protein